MLNTPQKVSISLTAQKITYIKCTPQKLHQKEGDPSEKLVHRGGVDIKWNGPFRFFIYFLSSLQALLLSLTIRVHFVL